MSALFSMELDKILKRLENQIYESRANGRSVTYEFIRRIKLSLAPRSINSQIASVERKANKHLDDYRALIVEHEKIKEDNAKLKALLRQRNIVISKVKEMLNVIGHTKSDQHIPVQVIVNLLEITLQGVDDYDGGDIDKVNIDESELLEFMNPIERRLKNIGDSE